MINKAIIFHIRDVVKKREYLCGVPGEYTITDLDLEKVAEYNFNDGNSYVFENCIFKGQYFNFKSDGITFDNCTFKDGVYLHNEGISGKGTITLRYSNTDKWADTLSISSPTVVISASDLSFLEHFCLTADNCDIRSTNFDVLEANIDYNTSCRIINCTIVFQKGLYFDSTGAVDGIDVNNTIDFLKRIRNGHLDIVDSIINGLYIKEMNQDSEDKGSRTK